MEKILVLMATYNGEKFLQEQLDSLYNQKDIEVAVLVRDDGSKDKTQEILENNSRKGLLKWYTGEHLNVANGFFDLMMKAKEYDTDFFAFCDQDDVWDLDKLSIAVDNIKKFDVPALYYSGQRLVDENLNFIENHCLNEHRSLKTRFVLSDFAGCTGVFNRKLLYEVISFKPSYMLMHDTWILRVCLALGGNVVVDPEPRLAYRQHGNNTVGLQHGLRASFKQVKQYLFEYHVEELAKQLLKGYGGRIIPEYEEMLQWICSYRKKFASKKQLLRRSNVDFCNAGLNLTYFLKVVLNKL